MATGTKILLSAVRIIGALMVLFGVLGTIPCLVLFGIPGLIGGLVMMLLGAIAMSVKRVA